jgi:aldehyde:ferredoxin oxidoreductase
MVERLGYNGKILHIDLSNRQSRVEEPGDDFWRIYGGGGLLAAYYLLYQTPAGMDAFNPSNLLILSSSVMAGHPYAGLARFTASAKSPLTGGIGETRCEGPFGMALKKSGFDALIFHNASSTPISVLIEDRQVSFHESGELWGKPVSQAVDALEAQFGAGLHTAVIGPAGENLVRFASIVTECTYQAARMGIGAVMGSKKLKAILLRDGTLPSVANPDACQPITDRYSGAMSDNPTTRWQLEPPGFSCWLSSLDPERAVCAHNYRDASFAGLDRFSTSQFMEFYSQEGDCPGCPNNCIKLFSAGDDAGYDPRAGGIHREIMGVLGPNCGLTDLGTIFKANILCNELGLDPTSLGFTLSMGMEWAERGLKVIQTEAGPLRFGGAAELLAAIQQIASRKDDGDLLAEGSSRAAAKIGGEVTRYAMHVKGLELASLEPRCQAGLALGYATSPTGPRFDICAEDVAFDPQLGLQHALDGSRSLGILEPIPMEYLGSDKVRNFKALSTLYSAADALDLCIFAIAPTRLLTPQDMADLLGAVTGWNTSFYEIMRLGERRLHLMRVYNLREGLTAAADTLPVRFFTEPLNGSGRFAGLRLERNRFGEALRVYYRMLGWDDAGRPRYETLLDHRLEWTVKEGMAARV